MGDIADQIIEGVICQECCLPLAEEHGYPVHCNECDTESGEELYEADGEPDNLDFSNEDLNKEVDWESKE